MIDTDTDTESTPEDNAGAEVAAEVTNAADAADVTDAADADDDGMSDEEYRQTVSQLVRVSAPTSFKHDVEETIRQRSGGRFFGRKAFGQRVPYEILAIIVLLIGLAAYYVLRSSTTGSLRYEENNSAPHMAPGAKDAVPQPTPLEEK